MSPTLQKIRSTERNVAYISSRLIHRVNTSHVFLFFFCFHIFLFLSFHRHCLGKVAKQQCTGFFMDWCQSTSEESKEGGHLHPVEELENHVHRPGHEDSQLNLLLVKTKYYGYFQPYFIHLLRLLERTNINRLKSLPLRYSDLYCFPIFLKNYSKSL